MSKTNIIVNLEFDGIHNWPAAKEMLPEVAFLSDLHRHKFFVTCKKRVTHDDRDVEIIMFKRDILDYLSKYFDLQLRSYLLGAMSCEMLARELFQRFDLVYCSILEDNENGAEITE
jgi:hypothetical protein